MTTLHYPRARRSELTVRSLADETVIYDHRDDSTYALNLTTTRVWNLCDGSHSALDIARELSIEFGAPVSQDMVWYALDKLEKAHLLQAPVHAPARTTGMTRRDFLKSAGVTALVAIPVILRVQAPTPAQIGSCGGLGTPCTAAPECCPGLLCNFGFCGTHP